MMAKLDRFCLLCVASLALVESRMRVRKFGKNISQAILDRTGFSKTASTRSKIQCAAACEQDDLCQKYSYDNNVCRMGEIANGSGLMYKPHDDCPYDRGYYLWIYDDMQLCLKYISSMMNQRAAKTACGKDGGHMALIESLAVRMRICDVLAELGDTDGVWLDGYDVSGGTKLQFETWKGEPLAWIEWGSNNPGFAPDEDCLFTRTSDGCTHRDLPCHYTSRAALCQIDII